MSEIICPIWSVCRNKSFCSCEGTEMEKAVSKYYVSGNIDDTKVKEIAEKRFKETGEITEIHYHPVGEMCGLEILKEQKHTIIGGHSQIETCPDCAGVGCKLCNNLGHFTHFDYLFK